MFSDGDLLGIPIRVIVSPRNLEDDCVEILTRDKKYHETVKRADVLLTLNEIIKKLEEEKDLNKPAKAPTSKLICGLYYVWKAEKMGFIFYMAICS